MFKFISPNLVSKVFYKSISICSLFLLGLNFLVLPLTAQTAPNPISLAINIVEKNGVRLNTTRVNNSSYTFSDSLDGNDLIRYQWQGVDLNLKYKQTPARDGGYIKVFKDTVTPENLLTDQGTDNYPLRLSELSDRLVAGQNVLLFVYVNSFTGTEYAPVSLTFNFAKVSDDPAINIQRPNAGAIFMQGLIQPIELSLSNFRLSPNPSNRPEVGKILVYANSINANNLIGRLTTGNVTSDDLFSVTADSDDFVWDKIEDNQNGKLIFVLTDSTERVLPYTAEVPIITNFRNSLSLGLPKLTIIEPLKNATNLSITNDTEIILQLENFELLESVNMLSRDQSPTNTKGYMQIIVISGDKGEPIQPRWSRTNFTLNDINYRSTTEGQKTIKVQLVNEEFEILQPEVSDSITFFYKPSQDLAQENEIQVESNVWRLVFIGLTVLLVVGGISVLITKG